MKAKHKVAIIVAIITAGASITVAVINNYISLKTEKTAIQPITENNNSNTTQNSGEEKTKTETIEELEEENKKLESQLKEAKSSIEELENTQKQNEEDISQYENKNADMVEQLEKVNSELKQIKEENKSLTDELYNMNEVNFLNEQVYVEGNEISRITNSIASIDGTIYYSDEIVKKILERYGAEYNQTDTKIVIQKDVDATKLSLSRAEVYEKDDYCVSTGSGLREDIEGDQFSGILINDEGGISFLVNEKYEKMSGVIHVAKETGSEHCAYIRIITYDKDGNSKNVFESKKLSVLANEQAFTENSALDITGAKIVRIEQKKGFGAVDAVISDAFFYNE